MNKNGCKCAFALAAFCLPSAITSCGGGGMTSTTPPPIQETTSTLVVVAGQVDVLPLTVSLDGQALATVSYLDSTNPLIVNSGQHELVISDANGPTLSQSITLGPNSHNTFIADGFGIGTTYWLLLTDDTTPAGNSNAKLRVVDGAVTATEPMLDVYVVPFGSAPSGAPTLSGLTFDEVYSGPPLSYQVVAPGSYDVYFTPTGTTNVLYHTGALALAANQNRTVVFLNVCSGPTTSQPSYECNLSGGPYTFVTLADLN
jgi:hypothetical protein